MLNFQAYSVIGERSRRRAYSGAIMRAKRRQNKVHGEKLLNTFITFKIIHWQKQTSCIELSLLGRLRFIE